MKTPCRLSHARSGRPPVRGGLGCLVVAAAVVASAGPAAQQSARVTQITHGPLHHYFGYIGQSRTVPWNADGRYLLALQVPYQDRLPGAGDAAEVCLIDTRNNYAVRVVDRTLGWNPQQGTMFYWNPEHPETQFFFNDRDPATGKVFTVLFDISADGGRGGRVREYRFDDTPAANAGVAQNGGYFTAINYARMARLRPVTGYRDAWDWTKGVGAPADDGVFRVDVGTGQKTLIVSFAQLKEALRGTVENLDARHFFINHTLNNRNNDLIYFFCRADFEQQVDGPRVNAVFTVRPDGSELTRHEVFIGGHPEWGWGPGDHRLARRPPGGVRHGAPAGGPIARRPGGVQGARGRHLAEPRRQLVRQRPSRRPAPLLHVPRDAHGPGDHVAARIPVHVEQRPASARSGPGLEPDKRRHRRARHRARRHEADVPDRPHAVRPAPGRRRGRPWRHSRQAPVIRTATGLS